MPLCLDIDLRLFISAYDELVCSQEAQTHQLSSGTSKLSRIQASIIPTVQQAQFQSPSSSLLTVSHPSNPFLSSTYQISNTHPFHQILLLPPIRNYLPIFLSLRLPRLPLHLLRPHPKNLFQHHPSPQRLLLPLQRHLLPRSLLHRHPPPRRLRHPIPRYPSCRPSFRLQRSFPSRARRRSTIRSMESTSRIRTCERWQ